jgi:DNA/RNA-binding domain of Phe-tRNA-synthetase-like protein
MIVTISEEIKKILPSFNVIAYTMDVDNKTTEEVSTFIDQVVKDNKDIYTLEQLIKESKVLESRNGYKKLGKDPSHTRVACENLLRRIIKGQPLYRLGDIIDLGNVLSILTRRSVCVVDQDKLVGDVAIRLGTKDDIYNTINRGPLNVDKIPVYVDGVSPFGCPSSDTLRTAVDQNTKSIFIMIICFEETDIKQDEKLLIDIYTKYTNAKNIKKIN